MAANIGKISVTTTTALRNGVLRIAEKTIKERLDKGDKLIQPVVGDIIEKYVLGHRVIRALLGFRSLFGVGQDLQAEFGLSAKNSRFAVEIIVKILRKAISYKTDTAWHKDQRGARLDIYITALDEDKYYDQLYSYSEPLSYASRRIIKTKKGRKKSVGPIHQIDWMKWLLEAKDGTSAIEDRLPDIKDYGITYDIWDGDNSRSGRAIMINMKSKNTKAILRMAGATKKDSKFPYEFPQGAKPARGAKNFIDEIARDPSFKKEVKEAVFKELQKAMPRTR